ncbi:MAG: hypothetical protein ACHREM_16710 [Polyangiales bacterium]
MKRRALKRRYGRSASSVRIYMGRPGGATEVVKKLADGWHYRLWDGSPWVGPFDNKGYAIHRRDLALTKRGS